MIVGNFVVAVIRNNSEETMAHFRTMGWIMLL